MAITHGNVGDVQLQQGDLAAALASYEASHAIIRRLVAGDPSNTEWQRDLAIGYANIGDVRLAEGDFTSAAESYNANLSIAARFASADPTNTLWQRHLSISYRKLGDVRIAQGNVISALSNYEMSLPIAERLAAFDKTNAQWQSDLAAGLYEIATVATGAERLDAISRALKILDELKEEGALTVDQTPWPDTLRQFLVQVTSQSETPQQQTPATQPSP